MGRCDPRRHNSQMLRKEDMKKISVDVPCYHFNCKNSPASFSVYSFTKSGNDGHRVLWVLVIVLMLSVSHTYDSYYEHLVPQLLVLY